MNENIQLMLSKKMTMQLVDDSRINREMLKNIFQDEYEIIESRDGAEALKVINSGRHIDIILLDIIMPVMSGIEFLEIIKNDEKYKDVPVIINTQYGEQENELKALELGADDFIVKPYNPDILKRRVKNLVRKSVLEKQEIQTKLNDTARQLDMLVETIPGGISVYEVTDRIRSIYNNSTLSKMLGYSMEELDAIGNTNILNLFVREDRRIIRETFFKNDNHDNEVIKLSARMIRKDGTTVWMGLTAKRFKEMDGTGTYHVIFTDLTDEKEAEKKVNESVEKLKFRAERDVLTGIYNRETFYKKTEELLKKNPEETFVLTWWNIDRFKVVNELFGTHVGDQILIWIAKKFDEMLNGIGTYGRLETDHFVSCTQTDDAIDIFNEIEQMLYSGLTEINIDYPIICHAGFYEIVDKTIPVDLMCDRASMALQTVKGNYLTRSAFYNENLRNILLDEQEIINSMEHALRHKQFYVSIQPIYSVDTREIVSAEALVRWKHSVRGNIPPSIFVPIFEKNGFITKLDMFVWEEVCRYISERIKNGKVVVPISVNVSRMDFYNPKLADIIGGLVEKYNISHNLIKLEITESAYTDNPQQLMKSMDDFRRQGFKVLMDDFGSGYSSLNMLKDVAVDVLKVDMEFISNLEDSERACNILFNIVNMSKSLGMEVIAEGVETRHQYELLANMGCDCIQGYFFSKPLTEEEFGEKLDRHIDLYGDNLRDRRQKILVVDDQEINRVALRESLQEKYFVAEVCDGLEAIEYLDRNSAEVNLMVLDLIMPKVDGFEVLAYMKDKPMYRKIPILVVTAYGDIDNEIKALELGALDVITKPFDMLILKKRINNLLKISEANDMQSQMQILRESFGSLGGKTNE